MPSLVDDRIRERIAAVGGAQDRAAETQNAGHIFRPQHARTARLDEAVEAVFDAEHLDAGVAGRLHDRSDDGVETRARLRRR